MILRAIVGAISAFFQWVFKAVAWLIKALGLWIPLLYCITFLFVCVLTSTPLSTVGTTFFTGLIVSFVAAVALAAFQNRRAAAKRKAEKAKRDSERGDRKVTKVKKKDDFVTDEPIVADYDPSKKRSRRERKKKAAALADTRTDIPVSDEPVRRNEYTAPPAAYDDRREPRYEPPKPERNEPSDGEKRRPTDDEIAAWERKYMGGPKPAYATYDERPLVFATRKDPSIYVYEYSDRMQFFKREGNTMRLLATEYKRTEENR